MEKYSKNLLCLAMAFGQLFNFFLLFWDVDYFLTDLELLIILQY